MKEYFNQYLINDLKNKGIDINDKEYKNSENYIKIKDAKILGVEGGGMNYEEYIERYLLPYDALYTFESIYDMGNNAKLSADSCQLINLAYEIMDNFGLSNGVKLADQEEEANELVNYFIKPGGLISRLKKHFNFDIELFDKNNHNHQCEIFKILYLLYSLENRHFKGTNILLLLSKPSMENIDNSFCGWKTSNGDVIRVIKNSLEKELPLAIKKNIKDTITFITLEWDNFLRSIEISLINLAERGYEIDFEKIIEHFTLQPIPEKNKIENDLEISPIKKLYINILQHEFLGQVKDLIFINNIQTETNYFIPSEFIKNIKLFHKETIEIDAVKTYIKKDALKIANLVYLKTETNKEERRKIRKCADKVHRFLEFYIRIKPRAKSRKISKLLIISCLQAIILDERKETFNYTFHRYEEQSTRKPQVQGALNNDERTYDALQVYWVRKVYDRWYANLRFYELRKRLKKFENFCDGILIKILECSNIDDMLEIHNYYITRLEEVLKNDSEKIIV